MNKVIEYISEEKMLRMGYDEYRQNHPEIVDSITPVFYSPARKRHIPDFMIENVYTLEEGLLKYPELAL